MVIVGLLYLIFEDKVLADPSSSVRVSLGRRQGLISRTIIGVQVSYFVPHLPKLHTNDGSQIGLIILAMLVTRSSALSVQAKQGVPRGNLVVGWLVFILSFLVPIAHRLEPNNHYLHRLLIIFLTCAPTFVILTISYEGLFYFAFSLTLLTWVRLEHHRQVFLDSNNADAASASAASKKPEEAEKREGPVEAAAAAIASQFRPLRLSDARVALFFFVLLQSAFFSTGNVASISSFSLESVCRLVPVFDPFSQGALLVLKLMIPFALISANLGVLNRRLGVAPSALFMAAMALSDILTLYFFWVVRDEGSWLEIGSTISHFAIASLLCVFVAALEGVSALFIAGIEVEVDADRRAGGANAVTKAGASANANANAKQQQQQQQQEKGQGRGGGGRRRAANGSARPTPGGADAQGSTRTAAGR